MECALSFLHSHQLIQHGTEQLRKMVVLSNVEDLSLYVTYIYITSANPAQGIHPSKVHQESFRRMPIASKVMMWGIVWRQATGFYGFTSPTPNGMVHQHALINNRD